MERHGQSVLYDASSKRLHHSYPNGPANAPGFLHDYAFLINGLLDLYQYGGKIEWLMYALIYLVNIFVHYITVIVRFDSIRGLHFMVRPFLYRFAMHIVVLYIHFRIM